MYLILLSLPLVLADPTRHVLQGECCLPSLVCQVVANEICKPDLLLMFPRHLSCGCQILPSCRHLPQTRASGPGLGRTCIGRGATRAACTGFGA